MLLLLPALPPLPPPAAPLLAARRAPPLACAAPPAQLPAVPLPATAEAAARSRAASRATPGWLAATQVARVPYAAAAAAAEPAAAPLCHCRISGATAASEHRRHDAHPAAPMLAAATARHAAAILLSVRFNRLASAPLPLLLRPPAAVHEGTPHYQPLASAPTSSLALPLPLDSLPLLQQLAAVELLGAAPPSDHLCRRPRDNNQVPGPWITKQPLQTLCLRCVCLLHRGVCDTIAPL